MLERAAQEGDKEAVELGLLLANHFGYFDEYRDVLVEVKETNTGSLSFGAAVTSDAGLLGQVSLRQRNFDITDFPDSWGELTIADRKAFMDASDACLKVLYPPPVTPDDAGKADSPTKPAGD